MAMTSSDYLIGEQILKSADCGTSTVIFKNVRTLCDYDQFFRVVDAMVSEGILERFHYGLLVRLTAKGILARNWAKSCGLPSWFSPKSAGTKIG